MEIIVVIIILIVSFIIISFIINHWLWIVIGISIIVLIALIITLIYFFVFKKSKNKKNDWKKLKKSISKNKYQYNKENKNLESKDKKYIKNNDYWYIYNYLQNQLKLNINSKVENEVINNNRKIFAVTFGDLKKRLEKETIRSILIEKFEFYNSEAEKESWNNNEYFINILQKAKINNQCILGFEWNQSNNKRIDITIFGSDKNHKKQIILIELKAWSNDSKKIKGNV